MKFDQPAGTNPIDRQTVIGQPVDRIDGPLKTAGQARYAYEQHDVAPGQLYGVIVGAAIGYGRLLDIDTDRARAAPGVVTVVTARNAGRLGKGEFYSALPLVSDVVSHYHQAVAVVVANTYEQARDAAHLVAVRYDRQAGAFDLESAHFPDEPPSSSPDTDIGDFDAAFAGSAVTVDEVYETQDQSHAMMEPHATVATWNGGKLTIWTAMQIVSWGMRDLSRIFDLPESDIRIITPYIGGGFGGKASVLSDAVLAAAASRQCGRPVKIALERSLMFNNTSHRPATRQRVRIGADRSGRIQAIGHETWSGNLVGGPAERSTIPTASLYAGANRLMRTRLARLDLPEGNAMRAPGEAPGLMAVEVAMDELAEKLGLDPVELRLRNDTNVDPTSGKRFSTRRFADCLRIGAERFGWSRRNSVPGSVVDGDELVGLGVASAIRGNNVTDSAVRVRLQASGRLIVETDMTDIGTGSYTIIGQTAAEMLGLPLDQVDVRLGDSTFPRASGSLGQRGANSATSGTYAACQLLRDTLCAAAGANPARSEFHDGHLVHDGRRIPLQGLVTGREVVAEDGIEFDQARGGLAHQTFGAHFCEVRINRFTGEVRVPRMLAVCAAGRILNPKTARSQVIGAMTMGLGGALMESLAVDLRLGYFVNHDLATYEVPVHADIIEQDVIFLDDLDPHSSPMKAKGVSELGISGVAAAVANAIYNASGARVRQYPVTIEKIYPHLPV
ncbi:xanthine dehydrogenase family protein molybdopterin-binding subunit [Luteimonas fraxinea]|uniref:xanthine dehydrogenase family protein molybdopterin-binding subunit n=1 Tax=Luteimonas fraxinea TaxID=2901869 RepID=UPI001E319BC7|nr:xanthine dehydrogenase family protein molybdopterin-binding subunit [Luteimonas fraxinea]MCD9125793.1 xanthine dehydrogenase family protein molybdopterin-binding subunit [Luteimonas fraxinea]